jgi:exodeoxyribonuclease V alpha subunit
LFPDSAAKPNWQKVAAFAALRHRFSIITGGPGTGKTWTVARLLALLLQLPGNEALRVRVAAPTGKAVARLRESLTASLEKMPCPEAVRQRLQDRELTTTIHRLLVPIPNTGQFRHDPENPLPLDVLVVDETSMVSLSLMARLLAALRPEARLVLVGDKDQLPPVDPGGVLADLCEVARQNEYSKGFREQCKACTGEDIPTGDVPRSPPLQDLSDAVVRLRINHRSGNAVALHKLGVAVNGGDLDAILGTLKSATGDETAAVSWQRPTRLGDALRDAVVARYVPVLKASGPEAALAALGKFRILCALREGPSGTNAVNELVTQILADEAPELAEAIRGGFYAGKPVMVTANNYVLRLFNGDVGVFTQQNDSWQACFPAEEGGVRFVARERLPDSETVYAMTVHKSQGSEFDHVILVLPEQDNPVLSRELLYTAVTRARQSVRLVGSEAVLRMAVARLATRMSGLKEALGWRPGDASVAAAPPNAHKTAAGIGSQTQLNL